MWWRIGIVGCALLGMCDGKTVMAQQRVGELPPPSSSRDRKAGQRAALIGISWSLPQRGEGVVVQRVAPGSPAAEAGLRSGDVIRVIDDQPVRGIGDAVRLLSPGKRVALQYERTGRLWQTVLSIPVEPLPAQPLPTPPPRSRPETPRVRPMLGVTVRALDGRERLQRGIPQDVRGLLITQIQQGSPAARYGLPLGGVILDVDGTVMSEPDDLIGIVRAARLDRPLRIRYWHRGRVYRKQVTLAPELLVPKSVLELERRLESPGPAPPSRSETDEIAKLRQRIDSLETQVQQLTQRLEKLEAAANVPQAKEPELKQDDKPRAP